MYLNLKVKVTLRLTVSQSVSKSWCRATSGAYVQIFFPFGIRNTSDSYVRHSVGRPLWREDGSVFCTCRWPLPAQSFSVVVPRDLRPILLSQIWDFPFRRLLRLAGSRWRYSTPPPHGKNPPLLNSPRYIGPARTAQKTLRPLLSVLSLRGRQHIHRAVPQQQLLLGNGSPCHNTLHCHMQHQTSHCTYVCRHMKAVKVKIGWSRPRASNTRTSYSQPRYDVKVSGCFRTPAVLTPRNELGWSLNAMSE
jgi:hypothetical protein